MNSTMSSQLYAGYRQADCEWLAYIGCPMLYDGGLCVNREPQEVAYHNRRKYYSWLES